MIERASLVLALLLGASTSAQHHLGPSFASGGIEVTSGGPAYPVGPIHVWKMEQATGATRLDYIGSTNMTEAGTGDVSQVAGKSGYAAEAAGGAGGPYLTTGAFAISGDFSFVVWASSSAASFYAIGPQGTTPTVTIANTGVVTLSLWDPASGFDSNATGDCGTPGTWMLIVARFNQTAKTFDFRCYGFGGGVREFDGVVGSGPWVNNITSLNLEPFHSTGGTTTAGSVDEITVFNRVLGDSEADSLETLFYTP